MTALEKSFQFRANRRRLMQGAALAFPAAALGGRHAALAQDKPELQQWLDTTNGTVVAEGIVTNAIDPWNETGTATIKPTLQPNNWDATRIALSGGEGPDFVGTPGPSFAFELAKAGQVLDLTDLSASEGWDQIFFPWALALGQVDGGLYSIPNEVETLVLYYNKTLFEANGWTPATTIDELMTLAQTIQDAGIIPFAHANAEWRPANEWFVGEFFTQIVGPEKVYAVLSGGDAKFTDPEFVEAITTLTTMQQNGWFMGGLDRYYTTTFSDADAAIANGDAAMKIEGTWWIANTGSFWGPDNGNDNDWDWTPVPSKDGTPKFTLGIGSTNSINAQCEYPNEAAQYLSYYFSGETQARLLTEVGLAPAPVNIDPALLEGLDPRYAAILAELNAASAANNYGYTTWTFFPPKTETLLIENIEKVWAGDMTIEEYLQSLQDQFDAELAANEIPPLPARG
jgi:raffinose/stachyose/melibiose transport system substrate-binding protein